MSENNYHFEKLTPGAYDELNKYDDALSFIFKNEDIKNIAITSPYGAGKSSLIRTYKKAHPTVKFLNVSLAQFKSPNGESLEIKDSILERKLVNQLRYQLATNLPLQEETNAKKPEKKIVVSDSALIAICAVVSFLLFLSMSLFNIEPNLQFMGGAVLIFGFISFVYVRVNAFNKRSILHPPEIAKIDPLSDNDESYFDNHLDEILAIFKDSDADVIVFEDIDSYNTNQIFARLREINALVNHQRANSQKPLLRFFYLLRDDMFVSKERTKFFDFILPLVPVMDSSNSYDQFIEHFKECESFDLLEKRFLQGVSLYVDDMRLLKNIYNEFSVYQKMIGKSELNVNKLLAIITYKNLFPQDFSSLQFNKGFVFTIFSNKAQHVREETVQLVEQISVLKKKLISTNEAVIIAVDESNNAYATKIKAFKIPKGKNAVEPKEVKALRTQQKKRQETLESKANATAEKLTLEISELEATENILYNRRLCEIINRENINEIFGITNTNDLGIVESFNDVKSDERFSLIKYLLRNGYIDESYPNYMTSFSSISLSSVDKEFLRSITDKKAKEYNYKLQNPQMIIDRVDSEDFNQEELLNFSLFDHLLKTPSCAKKRDGFIQRLQDNNNFKFISEFLNVGKQQDKFVEFINKQTPDFFHSMQIEPAYSDEQKKIYAINTLYYSSQDEILAVNVENCLADFASNSTDFLRIDNPNISQLIKGFKLLDISFESLSYDPRDKALLESVYQQSLYQLNFEHISLMLNTFYNKSNLQDIQHKNYTLIMSNPTSALAQFINGSIDAYMDIILKKCNGEITDHENIAVAILNNENISAKNKKAYLTALKTQITAIDAINDTSVWGLLLNRKLVVYSEDNILQYFHNKGELSKELITFINSSTQPLDFSSIDSDHGLGKDLRDFMSAAEENANSKDSQATVISGFGKELLDAINQEDDALDLSTVDSFFAEDSLPKLFDAVIKCNSINDDRFLYFVKTIRSTFNIFDIEGVSDSKMVILIDTANIPLNTESIQFLRKKYSKHIPRYFGKNITAYMALILETKMFNLNDALLILKLNVDDTHKIKLLGLTDAAISMLEPEYSDVVKAHILTHNFDNRDITKLLRSYPSEPEIIKPIILKLAIESKAKLFSKSAALSVELYEDLLMSAALSSEDKIEFSILVLSDITEEQCERYFNIVGLTEYVKLFHGGRPKFAVNKLNNRILGTFKLNDWITSFDYDKEDNNFYRAYGKRNG